MCLFSAFSSYYVQIVVIPLADANLGAGSFPVEYE